VPNIWGSERTIFLLGLNVTAFSEKLLYMYVAPVKPIYNNSFKTTTAT
jgi:hypothetical protein